MNTNDFIQQKVFIHIIHLKRDVFMFAFGLSLAWAITSVEVSKDNNLFLRSKLKLRWEIGVKEEKLLCAQHQGKDGGSRLFLHIQTDFPSHLRF